MNDNIIDFNKAKVDNIMSTDNQEITAQERAIHISVDAIYSAVDILYDYGIDIEENPRCIVDLITAHNCILAAINRIDGVENEFQELSDSAIGFEGKDIPSEINGYHEGHSELMNKFLYGDNG